MIDRGLLEETQRAAVDGTVWQGETRGRGLALAAP